MIEIPEHIHTWVWFNFPTLSTNLTEDQEFYRLKNYLINKNSPAIIFTGTGTDLLYLNDKTLENHIFSKLSNKELENKTFDIYWYEPITFRFVERLREEKVNASMNKFVCRYGFFEEFDYDTKNSDMSIIEFDFLQAIATKYNIKFNVFTCDYNTSTLIADNYKHLYPNLHCVCYDIFIRDIAEDKDGVLHTYPIRNYNNSRPNYVPGYTGKLKYKLCSQNLRYSTHRQLVVAHLSTKESSFTWNYKINQTVSCHNFGWLDKTIIDCDIYDALSQNLTLLKKHTKLENYSGRKIMPKYITDHKYVRSITQHEIGYNNNGLVKHIHECFLTVVTESRFCQPVANISEKVLRNCLAQRPFLIVAPPYSLEYLDKLGFKSFNKWWDESYDKEENHTKRLMMIFDIVDYIDSLPYERLYELLDEMKDVLDHNYNRMKTFKSCKKILQ